jgi:hypothetical protein
VKIDDKSSPVIWLTSDNNDENHLDLKVPIHPYLILPQKRLSENINETKMTSLSQVYCRKHSCIRISSSSSSSSVFFHTHCSLEGWNICRLKSSHQTINDLHKLQEKFFIFLSPIRTLVKVCMLNAHRLKT